ncbi:hypothetical protein L9F63_021252, partial [Diploptera punctata]
LALNLFDDVFQLNPGQVFLTATILDEILYFFLSFILFVFLMVKLTSILDLFNKLSDIGVLVFHIMNTKDSDYRFLRTIILCAISIQFMIFVPIIVIFNLSNMYHNVSLIEFFGRLYQIPLLRIYRKHDRSLQGPTSWIKQQEYRQRTRERLLRICTREVLQSSTVFIFGVKLPLQEQISSFDGIQFDRIYERIRPLKPCHDCHPVYFPQIIPRRKTSLC